VCNIKFVQTLNQSRMDKLQLRVVHHLLRMQGAHLLWWDAKLMGENLRTNYARADKTSELIDANLTMADICLTTTNMHVLEKRIHLSHLGEALESDEQYAQAAVVYETMVDVIEDPQEIATSWSWAALAYKRAEEYDKSEMASLESLHRFAQVRNDNWNALGSDYEAIVVDNLLKLYAEQEDDRIASYEMHATRLALTGLLVMAGTETGWTSQDDDNCRQFVKNMTHPKAIKALKKAIGSNDVATFRETLLEQLDTSKALTCKGPLGNPPPKNKATSERTKQEAKRLVLNDIAATTLMRSCSNVACAMHRTSTDSTKQCPCKTVSYCDRACQAAHWTEHKQVCPSQLKKLANKTMNEAGDKKT